MNTPNPSDGDAKKAGAGKPAPLAPGASGISDRFAQTVTSPQGDREGFTQSVSATDSPGAQGFDKAADSFMFRGCVIILVVAIVAVGIVAWIMQSNNAPPADDSRWADARAQLEQVDASLRAYLGEHDNTLAGLHPDEQASAEKPVVRKLTEVAAAIGFDLAPVQRLPDFAATDFRVIIEGPSAYVLEVEGSLPSSPKGTLRRNADGTFETP